MIAILPKEELEIMREHTQYLHSEYVLRFPFAVVDATLHEHLRKQARRHPSSSGFKRTRLTDGSAHYTLISEFPDPVELATVVVRAVASEKTYLTCIPKSDLVDTPAEERAYFDGWCKFFLILFIVGLWSDQRRMATLDAISPTPANTHVLVDEQTSEETLIIIAPSVPQHDEVTTGAVPPIPDPRAGLERVSDWFDTYGSTQGLTLDQVARKIGLAPKTLYNARHATGRTRKKGKKEKPGKN
jgi:hypothetical protein